MLSPVRFCLVAASLLVALLSGALHADEKAPPLRRALGAVTDVEFEVRKRELACKMAELSIEEAKISLERVDIQLEKARSVGAGDDTAQLTLNRKQASVHVEMRKLAAQKGREELVAIYDAIKNPIVNKERPIYPNVDYPCGLTYYLMDLPLDLYTPLFVCSRITGWCAHYIEQSQNNRIYRPLSNYKGAGLREVPAMETR